MPVESKTKPIPIYTSKGDWAALMVYPHLFNTVGEWVGWLAPDRSVYDVDGVYVGWLTDEPRILRKRTIDGSLPRRRPPPPPKKVRPPATVPLPPMMAELAFETIDILDEEPDRLHTSDTGELKDDID
ncbi:MAG TPA: hypothetical protein VJJ46_06745 [Anaerolineales bacterium]|nr:hypothetical protein [Anaerolineales bacterium]